ncbi:MAG: hypothetical protein H0T89_12300 [Deltaproteobacteria bacterium]|nr:hypothetical protein [Deltaproteobacteria bacterium]MDQ3296301.1 hypothetical protein [Myxococcota bacterium]
MDLQDADWGRIFSRRHLKRMNRYRDFEAEPSTRAKYEAWTTDPLLGVYENPAGVVPNAIVVTTRGIYFKAESSVCAVMFADIASATSPSDKAGPGELKVVLRDGSQVTLRIEGSDEKYRDVYQFQMFMMAVVGLHSPSESR